MCNSSLQVEFSLPLSLYLSISVSTRSLCCGVSPGRKSSTLNWRTWYAYLLYNWLLVRSIACQMYCSLYPSLGRLLLRALTGANESIGRRASPSELEKRRRMKPDIRLSPSGELTCAAASPGRAYLEARF